MDWLVTSKIEDASTEDLLQAALDGVRSLATATATYKSRVQLRRELIVLESVVSELRDRYMGGMRLSKEQLVLEVLITALGGGEDPTAE